MCTTSPRLARTPDVGTNSWGSGRIGIFQYALPQPGPLGGPLFWGSDFVVVLFDSHNGLQMDPNRYTGRDYVSPSGKTMSREYEALFERLSLSLSLFSQVVYCYSDWSERVQMDSRLDIESRALAERARTESIKPFCL